MPGKNFPGVFELFIEGRRDPNRIQRHPFVRRKCAHEIYDHDAMCAPKILFPTDQCSEKWYLTALQ
uniref:Uncharacterized protein n=1 Tax=Romanomermis culicivorax TaxID=13658 RepID=A0A915JE12_ROMCU